MLNIENASIRYLIIKMGKLAEKWQEPYDDHDEPARCNNAPLKEKWKVYAEILEDAISGQF